MIKSLYMHTIAGKPAYFSRSGGQIVFASRSGVLGLAQSLTQIRREQRATAKFRRDNGFTDFSYEYGYVRIALTEGL